MTDTKSAQPKRTPIEDIGKINLIEKLLGDSSAAVSDVVQFSSNEECHYLESHSLLLEGIDFDLVYTPLKHLGHKAVLSVLGHLYSKNHIPETLSVRIGISKRFFAEDIEELWFGISTAARDHKINSPGLDLLPSLTGLTISLSSQGKQKKELFVQTRAVASGDLLCITGSLGAAYMGLQLLEREKVLYSSNPQVQPKLGDYKFILKSYLNPELNTSIIDIMNSTSIIPSDGEFISRGLADAVKRVCRRSGLGAKIFLDKIPIAAQTFEMAEELNIDATTAVLNGGDDMQMMFIIPLQSYDALKKEIPNVDIIGHLSGKDTTVELITPDGAAIALKAQGWSE